MTQKGSTGMLIVLFCAAFIAAFNENIVNVGLSDIMTTFAIGANTANWLVTGYMVITAIVVTLVAFLLKRIKLRVLFFIGSGVFVVGCALAFMAPTFPLLLACRLLQAVGTGIFIPTMMNAVLMVAPRKRLGFYLAIGSCCITFGPAFGPVVSGLMVTFFGWRTMFLVPMAAMVVVLFAGIFLVRNINKIEKESKLDIPSLLMSAVGLTALVYGLSELMTKGAEALVFLVLGLIAIGMFAYRQGKIENPLLNLAPLQSPRFSIACALVVVAMMTTFSMSVLLPLYFVGAAGTTALVAGALILIPILAQAVMAMVGGKVMDRRGEWPLLPAGFLLIAVGQVATYLVAGSFNLVFLVLTATLVYAGVGLSFSPSQTAGLKRLDPEMNSYGVSIMSTFIQIAAALGPSLFVGVLSSGAENQVALGVEVAVAQAAGFSDAILLAGAIALAGCVIAGVYSYRAMVTDRGHHLVEKQVTLTLKENSL